MKKLIKRLIFSMLHSPRTKYYRAMMLNSKETTSFMEQQLVFVTNPHHFPLRVDDEVFVYVNIAKGVISVQTIDSTGIGTQRVMITEVPSKEDYNLNGYNLNL